MSDERELLGYVIYGPDDDETEAYTECVDCHDGAPDDMAAATYRDQPGLGEEVPYSECFECGEVMRP